MFRYKNVSSQQQTLIGFGVVAPGQEFETSREVSNPNFVLVGTQDNANKVDGVQAQQQNAVIEVAPVVAEESKEG